MSATAPLPWLATTRGLAARRHLATLLGGPLMPWDGGPIPPRTPGLVGWGRKASTVAARTAAAAAGIPWITAEDGFIRSVGLGVAGAEPFGFVLDRSGVPYDASQPSDVELLLESAAFHRDPNAAALRQRMVALGLGKYNHDWTACPLPPAQRRRIVLVDQTRGDLSVELGAADAHSFRRMLDEARGEAAELVVRIHPDVIAGRRRGYLAELDLRGCTVLSGPCNPMALVQAADEVWCVTSQLGLEALLAERPVRCFGLPFYAGWGATRDALPCPRRTRTRTYDDLFWAAYGVATRYVDPVTGVPCALATVIDRLEDHRRIAVQPAQRCWALGFSLRKQCFVGAFAHPWQMRFTANAFTARLRGARNGDRVMTWGFRSDAQATALARRLGTRVARMEDGFVRSVGLGSDLVRPRSLVVDDDGIYFDPQQPSRLERILSEYPFRSDELERGARLIDLLRRSGVTKYNTGDTQPLTLPQQARGRTVILVPGQVEDDQSILRGCVDLRTNSDVLRAVRADHPTAFVLAKIHPDVLAGHRQGSFAPHQADADLLVTTHGMQQCLAITDEVHTLTSLTGFEALVHGKIVATYGLPFYAGWGLTRDRYACPRRGRHLSLEALVMAALVLYPRYVDGVSGLFIGPETVIERLLAERHGGSTPGQQPRPPRWWRWWSRLRQGR